jgi:glycosyltransferase involved in cell wall biosynthesis
VRSIERLNCRASDIVVVHVPEVGKQLARRWRIDDRRIVALPGGTNTALFHPLATVACRKAIGLGEGPLVGFVGTLYGYQGLQTLVEAAVTMRERNPGVRFLIVGSGPTEDELRATVRARGLDDAFVFTGWVPYGDVPRYINAMDVCVAPLMPDRGLAMPIKLFDYMACSRPVVVSARYDELDLWGEWPGVLYVVPGDPAALADGLLAILADPELSAAMGAANRHAVEESYSWAAIARRIATLEPTRGR